MSTPEQPGGTMGGGAPMGGAPMGGPPPPGPPPPGPPMGGGGPPTTGYTLGGRGGIARMPNPGNAEFLVLVLASVLLAIVAWIADGIRDVDWFRAFTFFVVAYLLSRGIAKASRVLEY